MENTRNSPENTQRGTIMIRHTREAGTLVEGASRADYPTLSPIFTKHRVRWSSHIGDGGAWFWRNSRGRGADTYRINELADALRAAGYPIEIAIDETPVTDIAALEAARNQRAEDRADYHADAAGRAAARAEARWKAARGIRDHIPPGQPILVGHHSEGRHRRDLARADGHERASVEEAGKAGYHANRAETAARFQQHRENVPRTLRRIRTYGSRPACRGAGVGEGDPPRRPGRRTTRPGVEGRHRGGRRPTRRRDRLLEAECRRAGSRRREGLAANRLPTG